MILFDNWTIRMFPETAPLAQQYDDGSRRVDVEGDLPEGYTWQLLVQCRGHADTLLLPPTQKGVGAVLRADNLSQAGDYYLQLRGTLTADGTTKRHTNVASSFVPESLTGLGTWPEVPTEFAQAEARILELYRHPPIPGSNGCWLVWDEEQGEYAQSQLALPDVSVGPPGPAGFSPTVSLTETAEGVRIDVTDQEGTKSASVLHGENGQSGADGVSPTVTAARNEADTGAVITAVNADGTMTFAEVLDGADGTPYTLLIATSAQLGGVQPAAKTDEMTQAVGVDETGGLWTAPGGSGEWELVGDITLTEPVSGISLTFEKSYKELFIQAHVSWTRTDDTDASGGMAFTVSLPEVTGTNKNAVAKLGFVTTTERYIFADIQICGNVAVGRMGYFTDVSNAQGTFMSTTDGDITSISKVGIGGPYSYVSGVGNVAAYAVGSTFKIYGRA